MRTRTRGSQSSSSAVDRVVDLLKLRAGTQRQLGCPSTRRGGPGGGNATRPPVALSSLRRCWVQRSARRHPHSCAATGIALGLALGPRSIGAGPTGGMSEMIGGRDPPWGALSPLHAAGQQRSARRHPRSGPPTGITLERLALGPRSIGAGPQGDERNDRQSRPTLGRALTVKRCWPAILGATASVLEPNDGNYPGAARARPSVDWSVPARQSERSL
jgi:hypothetical protein